MNKKLFILVCLVAILSMGLSINFANTLSLDEVVNVNNEIEVKSYAAWDIHCLLVLLQ